MGQAEEREITDASASFVADTGRGSMLLRRSHERDQADTRSIGSTRGSFGMPASTVHVVPLGTECLTTSYA